MFKKILTIENRLFEDSARARICFYWTQQLFLFALRIWIFDVFFFSGWLKITSWDTTLMLFEYEYSVPVIPFEFAAYLATFAEVFLPVLLLLGVFPRISALSLSFLNIIAAISYEDISSAGEQQHILWSLMLITLLIYGSGRLSLFSWKKN